MEDNVCDVNHLEADVLLPPRKRLLASFKRQNSDIDAAAAAAHQHPPPPLVVASSSSSASWPSPLPPSPTPGSPSSVEFQAHLTDCLSFHLNNCRNLSAEHIVEASKSAADTAVKAAEAARSTAQEKALVAAKAVAAAKDALAIVSLFSGEGMAAESSREIHLKKNKLKKHVQVQLLYKKHQPAENHRNDEELARKLHGVMNSSPRVSKNSSGSVWKGHQNKKTKVSSSAGRTSVCNEGFGGNPSSMGNGNVMASELDCEGSIQQVSNNRRTDEKGPKLGTLSQVVMENGEADSCHSREERGGAAGFSNRKTGRIKLKKLPLSICNFRDHANPKEDHPPTGSPLTDKNMGNPSYLMARPLFPLELSGDSLMQIEDAPIRKCQEFKATACVKRNKVME